MNRAEREIKRGKWMGAFITIGAHAAVFGFLGVQGLKTVYPPPEEKGVLMEFVEDERITEPITNVGKEPVAETVTPDAPVTLVQKSEAQTVAKTSKAAEPITMGGEGDVEKYEPPREEPINQRALFSSANNKKSGLAEQTATDTSRNLKAGHPQGNTEKGAVTGEPTARIKGINRTGKLKEPIYTENVQGTIVVEITVNSEGKVTAASVVLRQVPGIKERTDIYNAKMQKAATDAALASSFAPSTQDSNLQVGYIIYYFKLK